MTREELLHPDLVRELQAHAREAYPNEAIGLVLRSGYKRMTNVAGRPGEEAHMPVREVWAHQHELVAVFHSHPNGPNCPSEADMQTQVAMAVPAIICSTNGDACWEPFAWGDQLEPLPLVGRGFMHGVTDCYELIRDHRWIEFGERLPQFPRSWEWWANGKTLYADGFGKAGYRVLEPDEPLQVGDGFLAAVRSPTPNHGGVYVGNGLILHHATGRKPYDPSRLSVREPWFRWKPFITAWVRRDAS